MNTPFHGWLTKVEVLPWSVEGVDVDPGTRTRREEYWWAAKLLRGQPERPTRTLLDAATGYTQGWHMLPYVAARIGWDVTAVDLNPATLRMEPAAGVQRAVADIRSLPYADDSFDVVACISVLEHLGGDERAEALSELVRVARHSLLLTADEAPWLAAEAEHAGCAVGFEKPTPEACIHLSPQVYAVYAHKLHRQ